MVLGTNSADHLGGNAKAHRTKLTRKGGHLIKAGSFLDRSSGTTA